MVIGLSHLFCLKHRKPSRIRQSCFNFVTISNLSKNESIHNSVCLDACAIASNEGNCLLLAPTESDTVLQCFASRHLSNNST